MKTAMTFNLGKYQVSFYVLEGKHCFVIERQGKEVFKDELGFKHQTNALYSALKRIDLMEWREEGDL